MSRARKGLVNLAAAVAAVLVFGVIALGAATVWLIVANLWR